MTITAQELIGSHADDDYILRPIEHASQLPSEAGALARVLQSPSIAAVITKFNRFDRRAVQYQFAYKLLGRSAIILQAMGTVLGAVFILVGTPASTGPFGTTLSIIELSLILFAIGLGGVASATDLFKKWNEARASAEVARIEYFSLVVSNTSDLQAGEVPLLPLQLEYFRRYQLQIQKAYYRGRGAKHLTAHRLRQSVVIALSALTLLLLAASANQTLDLGWQFGTLSNAQSAFAGLVIATTTAALGSLSMLNQDENNFQRYAATYSNLQSVEAEYLESAREAARNSDYDGVVSFANAVNDLISLEHRQWIFLQEIASQPDIGPLAVIKLPKLRKKAR